MGNMKQNNHKEYIANDINPFFGKMFEFDAKLPTDRRLIVNVKDHDSFSLKDDVIGFTEIDLENRFLSLHRAHVGLPQKYQM